MRKNQIWAALPRKIKTKNQQKTQKPKPKHQKSHRNKAKHQKTHKKECSNDQNWPKKHKQSKALQVNTLHQSRTAAPHQMFAAQGVPKSVNGPRG